jgi:hypothetical protein
MELTKTKMHNILKKYRAAREQLNKDWSDTCRRVNMRSTETHIALPSIYEFEAQSSKGSALFINLMKEFDGYEVFPKKNNKINLTEQKTTEEVLSELAKFMFDNGVTFVKSANAENKLVVSIYREQGLVDDYEFDENITSIQIEDKDFVKLTQ